MDTPTMTTTARNSETTLRSSSQDSASDEHLNNTFQQLAMYLPLMTRSEYLQHKKNVDRIVLCFLHNGNTPLTQKEIQDAIFMREATPPKRKRYSGNIKSWIYQFNNIIARVPRCCDTDCNDMGKRHRLCWTTDGRSRIRSYWMSVRVEKESSTLSSSLE